MAIYHFSAKVIQRSAGRSVVAAAAYRAAERLHDERLKRDHDYRAKAGVIHTEILLPAGAPLRWHAGENTSAEEQRATRERLWNEVEQIERRKDAVLAREVEFALPRELSRAEGIQLARDFVREQFVNRGMVADLCVHWTVEADGAVKPHAHVLLGMREVEGDGFGQKQRAWNDKALLREWRERWGTLANERLSELGHDVQIDHRSYAAQGIELEPQNKIGPAGARRAERGEEAERAAEHEAIARRNGARIIADPSVALDALTRQQSTFTRQDLARLINRQTADAEQFASVLAVVEASPELVRLGQDGRGRERFTTREMLGLEQRLEQAAAELSGRLSHAVALERRQVAMASPELGEEQRVAVGHVTRSRDLCAVVGYAGTGKSTLLGVARQAWEAEGYRVRGAALSGIAAEGLEAGSGISSRTLASLEWGWKESRDALTSRDVLVVDEAGMIGSRQLERVLSHARQAGAKVVLVGDPEQLQAIEAGAAFRAIAERAGWAEISAVRRQREGWQQEATRELATGHTGEALARYEAAGMVVGHETREEAREELVAGWEAERRAAPAQSQVMLAYTRADVAALNRLARDRLRAAGELGPEQVVQTERGERAFAAGDRVMFLQNERGLGVKNGSLGTVAGIEAGGRLTVRLDGSARRVSFELRDYAHVDHGYAATIHKAQGVTVDRAHVLASGLMDRHAAYVALTRHRDGVVLHYGRDEFSDGAQLARALGRAHLKDTSLDYGLGPDGTVPSDRERWAADGLARGARAYAERRGLDPLRPASEIVVRPELEVSGAGEQAVEPAQPVPRPGRFGGLRLSAGVSHPVAEPELELAPAAAAPPPGEATVPALPTEAERLGRALAGYARAWVDAARMERAGLPVLAHQEAALARAGAALEAEWANGRWYAERALRHAPGLAEGVGEASGLAALARAMRQEVEAQQALWERGRATVQAWEGLERAYEQAEAAYDWTAKREAGGRLTALAQAVKDDRSLDSLLRQHGRELGIEEGSRLAQVVQAREEDLARTLRRELALRQGPSLGMGM